VQYKQDARAITRKHLTSVQGFVKGSLVSLFYLQLVVLMKYLHF
jgi:hypothetical protein